MAANPIGDLCFLETQLPVAKLSIESYTERKAVAGQTLTGLGKWWGRKPLILCRATILGLLLPTTDDPAMDRVVFERLLTMDDDGMLLRKQKAIAVKDLWRLLPPSARGQWFTPDSDEGAARWAQGVPAEQKAALQRRVFLSLPYNERLDYVVRPEQIAGPSPESWRVINAHLGTTAANLQELVAELGQRRFGRIPRVGDAFCGGGSVPFEAARLGCEAYGSDLNPVAALLTWAALNLVGGGPEVAERVQNVQREVFDAVDRQITDWGIEHGEPDPVTGRKSRADAYLYCIEATCPACGWRVPMAPSWVVSEKPRRVVELVPLPAENRFDFRLIEGDGADRPTNRESRLVCANCPVTTPIAVLRGDGLGEFGPARSRLRGWENRDVRPRSGDVFGERLYCIRWVDKWTNDDGREESVRSFAVPTAADLRREEQAWELLMERFEDWQRRGVIPSRRIERGSKTDEPIRTRGWTHWHHLFTPRQLLTNGLFQQLFSAGDTAASACNAISTWRFANWNSRLCRWQKDQSGGAGGGKDTYTNNALNTMSNYSTRGILGLPTALASWTATGKGHATVEQLDARRTTAQNEIWITDPPYADAVAYDELSEFFVVWRDCGQPSPIANWEPVCQRPEAVVGTGQSFNEAMVECYRNLTFHSPENGLQVVMFTHQDAAVWADLAAVLWASGLRVTAAWCIATETGPAAATGNNVQGTVLLVLRKRTSQSTVFLNQVQADIELEVRDQLDNMRALDDVHTPQFGDTDYQLAAYAAALRVITANPIFEIDPERELRRQRAHGEVSPLQTIIESARKIANDHLKPTGIERDDWRRMAPLERFYLKGLEMQARGERRVSAFQELGRGFGADYDNLMRAVTANDVRLKTPSDFGSRDLRGQQGFAATPLRDLLYAVHVVASRGETKPAVDWLKLELGSEGYRVNRRILLVYADFIAARVNDAGLAHWHADAAAAQLLAGALRNDYV